MSQEFEWDFQTLVGAFVLSLVVLLIAGVIFLVYQFIYETYLNEKKVHEGLTDANSHRLMAVSYTLDTEIPTKMLDSDYAKIKPYILKMSDATNQMEVGNVDDTVFGEYKGLMLKNMSKCRDILSETNSGKFLESTFKLIQGAIENINSKPRY